jgi:dTDP-4-amino-4,6-dideoxygalactose transaminase
MPSFTFVSTANAVVLRRGVPVFVDIDPRTLNMDPDAVRAAVTPKTKAIMPVHYAGVGCDMDQIMAIAAEHDLVVIEDAAHGMGAKWKGRHLGTIGEFGVLSFHETKNIVAGEGGAILVNDSRARERAEIVRDKGTNRKKFLRGEIDRYTWVDLGSSFLPGELQAGLLVSQLEQIDAINGRRLSVWNRYHSGLENLEAMGKLRRPQIPAECAHNAHIYWVVLADGERRGQVRQSLATRGIQATSHYECLHKSPVAARQARVADGGLPVTENVVRSILRLPLHPHLSDEDVEAVIDAVTEIVTRLL